LKYIIAGDLTGDLIVDTKDLAIFSNNWLVIKTPHSEPDFNNDGIVNFKDFAMMAQSWAK